MQKDIDRWLKMYPRVQGIFFDEMIYEDTGAGVEYQAALSRYAHDAGCWPTVANPGAETPGRYFAAERGRRDRRPRGGRLAGGGRLKGDYFGGYADYPPFTRGVLVHSQARARPGGAADGAEVCRWVYVTEGRIGRATRGRPTRGTGSRGTSRASASS